MLGWNSLASLTAAILGRFIAACRERANGEAASPEEVVAVAYAYGVRQLKYEDTDKTLARALIRGCIDYFQSRWGDAEDCTGKAGHA
jgi:hypothetical protein